MCFIQAILKKNLAIRRGEGVVVLKHNAGGIMACHNTTIYNGLLRAIDEGRPVTIIDSDAGDVYYVFVLHVFSDAAIILVSDYERLLVTPSDGYSSSDLYTPRNITPTEQYMPTDDGGSHNIT